MIGSIERMAKIVVINHLTLDGVMQSPGRADEDTRGGFTHGGLSARNADAEMLAPVYARVAEGGGLRLLLGRRSYEEMLSYWNSQDSPFKDALNNAPKYVASQTLAEPLPWPNSTLLKGEGGDAVAVLKEQSPCDLFVMGSGALIETLMRRQLIDEYLLVIHPLVLGSGRKLFADGSRPTALRLVESKTTAKGVVVATYEVLRNDLPQSEASPSTE
jgi:dihydrofolate reductase